jgi:general secretion pathway protein D
LGQLFGTVPATDTPAAKVAPGQVPVKAGTRPPVNAAAAKAVSAAFANAGGQRNIRIVADTERNSLLITATPRQYRKILGALEKLDITPLQVLIEATIVEVRLQGDLRYGLQWFFEGTSGDFTATGSLDGTLDSSGGSGLGPIFPGFNFALVSSAADIQAIFSALAEDSLVEVLSSPSVMVLDNRTARIQVGDQVPIATQQQQNIESTTAPIINTIEYRDTGVVLEVVPRVTPGGLVTLEVDQEVSDVSATSTSTLDSPTFTTRRVTSSIAVQDGEAVVLGGLISGVRGRSNGGVPGLRNLPGLGWLFSQNATSNDRTELVVVLKPRVIASSADARRVAQDYRQRMRELEGGF